MRWLWPKSGENTPPLALGFDNRRMKIWSVATLWNSIEHSLLTWIQAMHAYSILCEECCCQISAVITLKAWVNQLSPHMRRVNFYLRLPFCVHLLCLKPRVSANTHNMTYAYLKTRCWAEMIWKEAGSYQDNTECCHKQSRIVYRWEVGLLHVPCSIHS